MAHDSHASDSSKTLHPGSSAEDAKKVGGKGDFGVPVDDVVERTYVSENTKHSDPGGAPPRSGADDARTSGAGGYNSGVGSSSGGDLDPDFTGVGTGGGIAASGKIHEPPGPDDAPATRRDAEGGRWGKNPSPPPQHLKPADVMQPVDDSTVAPAGASAVSNPDVDNNASVGEVSSDEATGRNDGGG